jgi:hypothetical protein
MLRQSVSAASLGAGRSPSQVSANLMPVVAEAAPSTGGSRLGDRQPLSQPRVIPGIAGGLHDFLLANAGLSASTEFDYSFVDPAYPAQTAAGSASDIFSEDDDFSYEPVAAPATDGISGMKRSRIDALSAAALAVASLPSMSQAAALPSTLSSLMPRLSATGIDDAAGIRVGRGAQPEVVPPIVYASQHQQAVPVPISRSMRHRVLPPSSAASGILAEILGASSPPTSAIATYSTFKLVVMQNCGFICETLAFNLAIFPFVVFFPQILAPKSRPPIWPRHLKSVRTSKHAAWLLSPSLL